MRNRLLAATIAIALALGLHLAWRAGAFEGALDGALSADARLALEVGCRGRSPRATGECRDMLRKLYLAGSLDPEKTLRAYCDEVRDSHWGGSRPPPPKLCVERFGGWPAG